MIKTIFKYEYNENITLPSDFKICDIQEQNGKIVLWCLVDHMSKPVTRNFKIFGTGSVILSPEELTYLRTVSMKESGLVWHVFIVNE